jgi:hypothetical protein
VAVAALLVACGGDDDDGDAASVPPTSAASGSYVLATGPDDVIVSVAYEGGFVPVDTIFTATPAAMITGDGLALSAGAVPAIYPGPLVPSVVQRTITRAATQEVVALADELGLLRDVTYARNDQIADAPDTVVTITVDGTIYRHQAYALGLAEEDDPDRANLAEFVSAVSDLPTTVGADQLGQEQPYAAAEYLIQSRAVNPDELDTDIEPTVVEWPADASVRLADAWDCLAVPADELEPLFADATQLTFFRDGDVTYQVLVTPRVPGREC